MATRTRIAGALAAAALLAGCAGEQRLPDGTPGGSSVATAPGGLVPPPGQAPSLDGVHMRLREVARVGAPVALTARPGTTTLYVAEKAGRVRRVVVDRQVASDGVVVRSSYRVEPEPVLDLTASIDDTHERGLLGLAFSPDGSELYTYSTDRSGTITLDAYPVRGDRIDAGGRRVLLRLPHPRTNHNGGQLATGPDGYLYVGVGDGGGSGDPDANGQNPSTLYGTILRIDPSRPAGGTPYGIPEGNPFGDGAGGAPEVWSWGLRNPWRFSIDRRTRDLWIGDVGQDAWEEINLLPAAPDGTVGGAGANLGWSRMEGSHAFRGGTPPAGHVPPLYEYPIERPGCTSVIGGYVYRGATHPAWQGVYVWADYCLGEVRTLARRADGTVEDRGTGLRPPAGDLQSGGSITSFGEDADGELYVLSADGGVFLLDEA